MKQYIFGIDIGGTKIAVTLADCDGNFYEKEQFATQEAGGCSFVIERIFSIMEDIMTKHGLSCYSICGAGISCGGPLDDKKGIILSPPNLPGWDDIHIVELFEKKFPFPAYLKNDADACAIAEWQYGAGKGTENMIFMTFGTGLGAGLILNGKPYSGACGMAGEAGHIRLEADGPVGYNKKGSFEGFCSGGGIAQLARSIMGKPLSAKEVAECAYAGDESAVEVMRVCGRQLGRGLSILVDLFNPECVVIGGIYMRCEDLLYPYAMEVMKKECLPQSLAACRLLPAALGEKIGDYAAISIATERLRREHI